MLLTELFNANVEVKISPDNTNNSFSTDTVIDPKRKIEFTADRDDEDKDKWDVSFAELTGKGYRFDATGGGDEFKVFSAVKKSFEMFVAKYDPKTIVFVSSDLDRARSALYERMIKKFARGFKLSKEKMLPRKYPSGAQVPGGTYFTMTKE